MTLKEFLIKKNISQARFAAAINKSAGAIAFFVSGQKKPSGVTAMRIEDATNGKVKARDLVDIEPVKEIFY